MVLLISISVFLTLSAIVWLVYQLATVRQRQVEARLEQVVRGGQVVVADRFYPSSKTCSACGHRLEALPLVVREWTCPACGVVHDRDLNAATNLKNMAVSSTVSACGEEGAGRTRKSAVKPASVKQEASSRFSQK